VPFVIESFSKLKNFLFPALMSSASANGFQMVVAGPQAKALNDFQVVNIQVCSVKTQCLLCGPLPQIATT